MFNEKEKKIIGLALELYFDFCNDMLNDGASGAIKEGILKSKEICNDIKSKIYKTIDKEIN